MQTRKLPAIPMATGYVNPIIGQENDASKGWRIHEHIAAIENEIGYLGRRNAARVSGNRADQTLQMLREFYELCRSASQRGGTVTDVALQARRRSHEVPVAVLKPLPVTLFAICAFVVEHGGQSFPAYSDQEQVLDWYLTVFLRRHPTEISPAHLKLLRSGAEPAWQGAGQVIGQGWSSLADGASHKSLVIRKKLSNHGSVLRSGDHVLFGQGGNARKFLLANDWWFDEPDFIWSKPWSALLFFRCVDDIGEWALIDISLIVPSRPTDFVEKCVVSINGNPVAKLTDFGTQTIQIVVPGSAFVNGSNFIGFHAARYCPGDFGSHDVRELGVAVTGMRMCFDV